MIDKINPTGGTEYTDNSVSAGVTDRRLSGSFDSLLRNQINRLTFSAHASERLNSRNIQLSHQDVQTLEEAVGKAADKGARQPLIHYNGTSYIVNVPNRTVITALTDDAARGGVFTGIDSAVIIN